MSRRTQLQIRAFDAAMRLAFERRLGVRTEGRVELADLGLDPAFRVQYEPSSWWTLPRILARAEVGPADVFADFGCGMGRMLLEAAIHYDFGRAIGIELAPQLAAVARRNVERCRGRFGSTSVELAEGDATAFPIPEDLSVAFFFNPFYGPVFEQVIGRLVQSVDRAPRRVRLIYANPFAEEILLATGRIHHVRSGRSLWSRGTHEGLRMYEID